MKAYIDEWADPHNEQFRMLRGLTMDAIQERSLGRKPISMALIKVLQDWLKAHGLESVFVITRADGRNQVTLRVVFPDGRAEIEAGALYALRRRKATLAELRAHLGMCS